MLSAVTNIPYPSWLNPGDNTWQLVAATLVGLMSLPGLAVLYGGLVRKKWIVNTMLMTFSAFSLTLIVWMLWGYNMAFGPLAHFGSTGSFWSGFIGHFEPLATASSEQGQAVSGANTLVPFHFPTATLAYFQFVFAAITPILFLGALVGRLKFKAWLLIVPLWITMVYCVNAALLWGGGFFAQKGAVDYSGGYVIHLSAGVAAFVGAWMVGPRRWQDRENAFPSNLMMVAVGAGIIWLGWNGFNGGDPFYAGADAAAAVLNTNVATAAGLLTWLFWDMFLSKQKKPTFLGAINGMICGLVAITPSAGWVNGVGAICVGVIASSIVWIAWTYVSKLRPFSLVDDAHRCRLHPRICRTHRWSPGGDPRRPEHGRIRREGSLQGCGQLPRGRLVLTVTPSISCGSSSSQPPYGLSVGRPLARSLSSPWLSSSLEAYEKTRTRCARATLPSTRKKPSPSRPSASRS